MKPSGTLGYQPTTIVQPTPWATDPAGLCRPFHGLDRSVTRVPRVSLALHPGLLSLACSAGLQGFQTSPSKSDMRGHAIRICHDREKAATMSVMKEEYPVMDMKPRPNHAVYIRVLRNMTPEQRLQKAFELSDLARQLFLCGLRKRFPHLSATELDRLFRQRLDQCHNSNY